MAWTTDLAAIHNPATGNTPSSAWGDALNANAAYEGAAWTSYTPTWTCATTPPAIGNGTLNGAYRQVGKTVDFRIFLLAGTTTTFGTGAWRFALPNSTTSPATIQQACSAWAFDSSGGIFYATPGFLTSSVAYVQAVAHTGGLVASAVPFTWATGDTLVIQGTIEVA